MVNLDAIEKRLRLLENSYRKLKNLRAVSKQEYLSDEGIQDRAERNLQVAIQCCIDIANHIVAEKGLKTPESYGEVFLILANNNLVPPEFADRLEKMAGLRNILVHEYLNLDQEKMYNHLQQIDDLKKFAQYVGEIIGMTGIAGS